MGAMTPLGRVVVAALATASIVWALARVVLP